MGDHFLLVVLGILFLLEQAADAELLQENCHVADLVVVGAVRIGVTALGQGLLAHPAHEVQHVLLLYFLHCRLLAMLDERIDAASVAADTFSVHTTVLQILEIRFDRLRQWYSRSCGSSLLHGAFLPRHLGTTAKRL